MITEGVFEVNGVKLRIVTTETFDCKGCYFESESLFDCISRIHHEIIPDCGESSPSVIFVEVKA